MQRKVLRAQNVSRMCAVCGRDNPSSLKGRFYELEDREILGLFSPLEVHQGYPGRVHGGLASAAVDETMGRAINLVDPDAWGVTVELTVRFRKPVPIDSELRVVARLTKDSSRMFESSGEIVLEDGTVAVKATGKFMKLPIDKIAVGDFSTQVIEDDREVPEAVEI